MTKTELESKHLAELHSLAAKRNVPGYRMLPRAELIEKLANGDGAGAEAPPRARPRAPRRERSRSSSARPKRERPNAEQGRGDSQSPPAEPPAATPQPAPSEEPRPRRRRRRRRPFSRKPDRDVSVHDLVLPPAGGRQVIVYGETREGCTALLREIAAELDGSKGPDPVVVLIEPSPDELVEWRGHAPRAEIVAAGQARHANDALAQARNRAGGGEDVMLLIDSLTRLSEAYGDSAAAKDFFDAGRAIDTGAGSLTVVAAVARKQQS